MNRPEGLAHLTFYRMHPTLHYEDQVDSILTRYVPRIGESVLVREIDSDNRSIAKVVGVRYLYVAPGSRSYIMGEGPIVDVLVEECDKFFREDPNVIIPDEES